MKEEGTYIRLMNLGIIGINDKILEDVGNFDYDKKKEIEECVNGFFKCSKERETQKLDYKNSFAFLTTKENHIDISMNENDYKKLNSYGIDNINFYVYDDENDIKIHCYACIQSCPKEIEKEEELRIRALYGEGKTINGLVYILTDETLNELTNRINDFIAFNLNKNEHAPIKDKVQISIAGIITAEIKISTADYVDLLSLRKGQKITIDVRISEINCNEEYDFNVQVERVK